MQIRYLNPGQTNVNVFIFPSDYAGNDLEIFSPYLDRLTLKSRLFDYVQVNNLIIGLYDNEMLVPAELPFELFTDMSTLIMCSKNCMELELLALADLGDNFTFSVSQEQLERLQKFGEYIC